MGLNEGDTTYIQGQVDAGPTSGQLHVYVGHKLRRGNAFDRAGLTNGHQFVVDVAERDCEHRRAVPHHVREERPVTTEGGRGATRHLTAAAWGG